MLADTVRIPRAANRFHTSMQLVKNAEEKAINWGYPTAGIGVAITSHKHCTENKWRISCKRIGGHYVEHCTNCTRVFNRWPIGGAGAVN